ncbi:hypothetical protein CASFOL_028151 [Castilleja foliolosa]|uniref:Uncharacterized protein n=1 Tax=Castilleja foliolosa TaxID=1961234 RepID=A0ABD3CES5_9LAMI
MICAIALSQSYEGTQEAGRSLSLKLLQQLEEQYQLSNRNTENIVSGVTEEVWCPIYKEGKLQENDHRNYCSRCRLKLEKSHEVLGVAHLVTNVQKTNWDVRVNVHHPDQVLNMKEPYSSKGTDDLRKHWAECFLE